MGDYYSHSRIKSWRRCRQSHYYKYVMGLVRRTAPAALLRGTTFHEMLDAPIQGKDWMEPLEKYREVYDQFWDEEKENYPSPDELISMYHRYQARWKHDGLDYEGKSEVTIFAECRGMQFKGIIDKLPVDHNGLRWVMDHKCLDSNHVVETSRGKVKMSDLKLSDKVFSSQGDLIGISEIMHQKREAYEIRLKGGRVFRATAEHRWPALVGSRPDRLKECLVDTQSIPLYSHVYLLPERPRNLPNKLLLMDPYSLGALIGDGSFTQGIRLCAPESEIIRRVEKGLGIQSTRVSLPHKADSYYLPGMKPVIRLMGLSGKRSHEKFIPESYFGGSIGQRMELLRGLMDTDGTVYKKSSYLFVTSSDQLRDDVQRLIWSLGGITLVRTITTRYQGGREGRPSHRLKFTLPESVGVPFHLSRKVELIVKPKRFFGSNLRVESIKPIGVIPVTDITVESNDHLFSVEGVLTHNTHKVLPDENTRFSDLQTVLYYWACRENGEKVDGVLWDYIRTKPPAIPETLKSGGLSKRSNIDTDYPTYYGEIKRLGLNPADYSDILEKVKKNVFFKRVPLPGPSEVLIGNVVKDFFDTAQEIRDNPESRTRNMTRDCKSCTYFNLCSAEVRGLDTEFIIKQMYVVQPRKEEDVSP